MAKLNGVKTVDMVNGEITKVEYNGNEYVKIADNFREAKTGDLFLSSGSTSTSNGGFYEINIREREYFGLQPSVRFIDDYGMDNSYMRGCHIHKLFRKVSEVSPTIEERVTTLESDVAVLKSTNSSAESINFKVGDKVKIIGLTISDLDYIGSVGEVLEEIDYGGDIWVAVNGDTRYFKPESIQLNKDTDNMYRPKVGDIVVITANESYSRNAVGDIGKVTDVRSSDCAVEVPSKPASILAYGNWTRFHEIRKATPAEAEQYERELAKATFSVGDYVKIVKSQRNNEGVIGIITETGAIATQMVDGTITTQPILLKHLTGKESGTLSAGPADHIIKAADEEVKWAKIGRKVNEYRKGDIIEYGCDGEYTMPPRFFKVSEIIGNDVRFFSNDHGNETEYMPSDSQSIRLVAPVESLFTTQN